jgi:hypothetical protein
MLARTLSFAREHLGHFAHPERSGAETGAR